MTRCDIVDDSARVSRARRRARGAAAQAPRGSRTRLRSSPEVTGRRHRRLAPAPGGRGLETRVTGPSAHRRRPVRRRVRPGAPGPLRREEPRPEKDRRARGRRVSLRSSAPPIFEAPVGGAVRRWDEGMPEPAGAFDREPDAVREGRVRLRPRIAGPERNAAPDSGNPGFCGRGTGTWGRCRLPSGAGSV